MALEENPPAEASPERAALRGRAALRDFTEDERSLILRTVNRFWGRWSGAFTGASREDMLGEAVLALQDVRERTAALPKAAAEHLLGVAIYRRLRKRVVDEYRQRLRHAARGQVELDEARLQALEAEGAADWDALVSETLTERAPNERLAGALRALSSLDRRILDLWFIEKLTHRQIAGRLNAAPERLPRQPKELTEEAVRKRYARAISQLRTLLEPQQEG